MIAHVSGRTDLERRGPREQHLQLEAQQVVADHHVGVLRLQPLEEPVGWWGVVVVVIVMR